MSAPVRERLKTNAPIPTWFGVGGAADAYAEPESIDDIRRLVEEFEGHVRVLGDGANLLVADDGVDGLVLSLKKLQNARETSRDDEGATLRVGAGAMLPKLIIDTVRAGLGGLEGLGGVPATIGGAVRMNAGGAFGQIAPLVRAVRGVTRTGQPFERQRSELSFGYRESGLDDVIITEVDLGLFPSEPTALRARLKDVMSTKKASQPLSDRSAGCVFRNPDIDGERVSAGMLIDRAGGKGLSVGGAAVSDVHANFIVVDPEASAHDVLELIERVRERVIEKHDVTLQTEIMIWRREEG